MTPRDVQMKFIFFIFPWKSSMYEQFVVIVWKCTLNRIYIILMYRYKIILITLYG